VAVPASLHSPKRNPKSLAAEPNHLRHERKPIQCAILIEHLQNLGGRPDLDKIARTQFVIRFHVYSDFSLC